LDALPATTIQQKIAVENAKTAIERDGIDARVRMEQQEADWRAGLDDQARAARVQAVEQRKNIEVAQLEAVDAITLQDKVRVEQLKTEIEVRAIKARAEIEKEQIAAQTERQVLAAQRAAMAQGIFNQPYLDQLGDKIRELRQRETEALQTATASHVDVAQTSSAASTRRIVTDHYRSIFDSLKQQAGGVFDALVTRSQSVSSAIGNSFKTAILTAIKDVVTSRVAAMLMQLFTGQKVSFAGGGSGNLPNQWKNSSYGIKYFRCERFDYDVWQKNSTLIRQVIGFARDRLGRPASECTVLRTRRWRRPMGCGWA
jgi:hypothetical protein